MKRLILFAILLSIGFSQTTKLEKWYIATQFIDATMSTYAIQHNMAIEVNPISKKVVNNYIASYALKTILTSITLKFINKVKKENPKLAKKTLMTLNVLYTAIIINNTIVMSNHKF